MTIVKSRTESPVGFFLPPANEVWGKVIFSQAPVILSMVGGGGGAGGFQACITGHVTRGSASRGVCIQGGGSASRVRGLNPDGGSVSRGSASRGVCLQRGRGLHLGGGWADPPSEIHGILRDTVNTRALRILLECILVDPDFKK